MKNGKYFTVNQLIVELNKIKDEYGDWEVMSKEGTLFEKIRIDKNFESVVLTNNCNYSQYDR